MTKFKLTILMLLITAFGVVVSGCVKKPQPAANVNQPVNTNTSTTTAEVDTSDWKTYRNEEYGFEFKYPESEDFNINIDKVAFPDPDYKQLFSLGSYELNLSVRLDVYPLGDSLEEKGRYYVDSSQTDPNLEDLEVNNLKIDRKDALLVKIKKLNQVYLFVNTKNLTYFFSYSAKTIDPNSYQYKIFENIYKSFKFID